MLEQIGKRARAAARLLSCASSRQKNGALLAMADALEAHSGDIIAANAIDLQNGRAAGLSSSLLDRLMLNNERISGMAKGLRDIALLPDPVGRTLDERVLEGGMRLVKTSVPIGVIAIIYEARPNVTTDSAALCLKSGNTVILRGGKEAIFSNKALSKIMRAALSESEIPEDAVQLIEDTSRESAEELMRMTEFVDLLIPRGGRGLIRAVVKNSTVPVIETGAGVCHIYVDKDADLDMAANIVFNAKTSRPSVCNAAECMLIHRDIAKKALPLIEARLREKNVEIRGDSEVLEILSSAVPATEDDWGCEFGDYIIAAKIVGSVNEAIEHIYRYSTMHSECIVSENDETARLFMSEVDSAAVYRNCSTRFTDGGVFGMGAEIGISTQKLHARGPLGLNELCSMKYLIYGDGQIRE